MRKTIHLFYGLLICCFITLESYGQEDSVRYKEVRDYIKSKGYTIKTEQQARLKKGEETYYITKFYEGTDYVLVAISDDTVYIDLFLCETDGTRWIVEHEEREAIAIFEFSPSFTRNMKVVVKNYDSSILNYASRCRFFIGYK